MKQKLPNMHALADRLNTHGPFGVFVYPPSRYGDGPKAYAVAPVRLTRTQVVVDGRGEVVWKRSNVQFSHHTESARWWIRHDRSGDVHYRRVGGNMGWRLIRVVEEDRS